MAKLTPDQIAAARAAAMLRMQSFGTPGQRSGGSSFLPTGPTRQAGPRLIPGNMEARPTRTPRRRKSTQPHDIFGNGWLKY